MTGRSWCERCWSAADPKPRRSRRDPDFPAAFPPNQIGWCPYAGGVMFLGPRPETDPGGMPYTTETFTFRGYVLRRRNLWSDRTQQWHSQTGLSVKGAGGIWVARVAGVTADGATMQEALDEAWAAAEFEDQLGVLAAPDAEAST
jgi:hypothetical protein